MNFHKTTIKTWDDFFKQTEEKLIDAETIRTNFYHYK